MGVIKNIRGGKLYRWRIDELDSKEKQQRFQDEMVKNTEHVSYLLESIGTTENDTELDSAGDWILE